MVYMFGGHQFGEVYSDVWSFSATLAAAGRVRWTSPTPMSASPSARWGHSSLLNINTQLLFGGYDAAENTIPDMWTMTPGCGSSLTMTATLGSFSDGDDSYVAGMDCAWLIQPAADHVNVMLVITALDLPDRDDRLLVYDGTSADASQIASFTGTDVPPPITSSRGSMFVQFVAQNNGGPGF